MSSVQKKNCKEKINDFVYLWGATHVNIQDYVHLCGATRNKFSSDLIAIGQLASIHQFLGRLFKVKVQGGECNNLSTLELMKYVSFAKSCGKKQGIMQRVTKIFSEFFMSIVNRSFTFAPFFSLSTNVSRNTISIFWRLKVDRKYNSSARILCHGGLARLDPSPNIVCMKYNKVQSSIKVPTFGLPNVNPAHSYPYKDTFLFLSPKFVSSWITKGSEPMFASQLIQKDKTFIIKLDVQYAIASYRCFWTLKNMVNFGAAKSKPYIGLMYLCGRTCVWYWCDRID